MALMLTYRMLAKKVVPYMDEKKIETNDVIGTVKNLYDEMDSDHQMNFGRLLAFIRSVYFHYDLTEKERRRVSCIFKD